MCTMFTMLALPVEGNCEVQFYNTHITSMASPLWPDKWMDMQTSRHGQHYMVSIFCIQLPNQLDLELNHTDRDSFDHWCKIEAFLRIMSKCRRKYLKDIQITINKPILNLEFNNNLSLYHQNTRGMSNKIDELLITVKSVQSPYSLCLIEHCMKLPGTSFWRKNLIQGGVSIFVRNGLKFNQIDTTHLCMEQDTECYAVQLESKFPSMYVLAMYRVPTGDFEHSLRKLDCIIN